MDSVIMIFQQRDLNEDAEGGGRVFRDGSPFPLNRPSGTFSLEGEGFPLLLKTVDSATPGKPFVQNDRRVS